MEDIIQNVEIQRITWKTSTWNSYRVGQQIFIPGKSGGKEKKTIQAIVKDQSSYIYHGNTTYIIYIDDNTPWKIIENMPVEIVGQAKK